MSGTVDDDLINHGYSEPIIFAIGLGLLNGVGSQTIRNITAPHNLDKISELDTADKIIEFVNTNGGKLSLPQNNIKNKESLRDSIIELGTVSAIELTTFGVYCITPKSLAYPLCLHDLEQRKPHWLFVRGNLSLLSRNSVAVVGTREATVIGEFLTKHTVSQCKLHGIPVISGLAKGIDTIAHDWALQIGIETISVLGSGILAPYPARNAGMAETIVNRGGLIISEYLPHQQPSADMFVWRNRLQACLSKCVIATEWKKSSGTAHTVRFANELNRPSVSLSLQGGYESKAAGRGAYHYELLEQQCEFSDFLYDSTRCESVVDNVEEKYKDKPESRYTQAALF